MGIYTLRQIENETALHDHFIPHCGAGLQHNKQQKAALIHQGSGMVKTSAVTADQMQAANSVPEAGQRMVNRHTLIPSHAHFLAGEDAIPEEDEMLFAALRARTSQVILLTRSCPGE